MGQIKVLVVPVDRHGVGKFRAIDPYQYIGEHFGDEIHVDIVFDVPNQDKFFYGYDAVITHGHIHRGSDEYTYSRIKWLKSNGIKYIVDSDDLWSLNQRHPLYARVKREGIAEKKARCLIEADYITTTTPIYRKTLIDRLRVKNVFIFPNAVDPNEPQFTPQPKKSDLIRFGWLGGSSHLHDIELMSSGISQIHREYKGRVQFVLCGFDNRGVITEIDSKTGESRQRPIKPTETVWYKYEQIFTNNYTVLSDEEKKVLMLFREEDTDLRGPYVRKWTRPVHEYANNYNYFDVSLAPLFVSDFNSNKSQLKAIEAGFHKKALIASETKPYTLDLISAVDNGVFNDRGNALLVSPTKNHKQWGKYMKKLIDNPNMIEDLGNRLYETVKDKYSLPNVSKRRVQFLKTIINK